MAIDLVTQPEAINTGAAEGIVDVDVHGNIPRLDVLLPHLEPQRQRDIGDYGRAGVRSDYPCSPPTPNKGGIRMDAHPGSGDPAGSDIDLLRQQLLDQHNVGWGVLTGQHHFSARVGSSTC
jgi:uncharacterized protein